MVKERCIMFDPAHILSKLKQNRHLSGVLQYQICVRGQEEERPQYNM
jgi:hypothetical protein